MAVGMSLVITAESIMVMHGTPGYDGVKRGCINRDGKIVTIDVK